MLSRPREGEGARAPVAPFTTNAGFGALAPRKRSPMGRSAGPRRRTYLDLAIKLHLSMELVNVSTLVVPAYGYRALGREAR